MMGTVLTEELFEVVAQGVGVAELATVLTSQRDSGFTLVLAGGNVLDIIGRRTIETVGVDIICVVTKLRLELQVLDDFPCESSRHVQLGALTLLIVVAD